MSLESTVQRAISEAIESVAQRLPIGEVHELQLRIEKITDKLIFQLREAERARDEALRP